MSELMWLPSLSHFVNGNGWSGGERVLRFQIETPADGKLTVVVWQDPFTRKYAEELDRAEFELTEEGIEAMRAWLLEKAADMNDNPPRTPEELRAWRDQVKEKENARA
ncbi:MAG: hypothetical protein EOM52_01285 [Clostridia bacterium]|nr:hypothetical protein [Clostridia bacterium]